MDKDSRDWKYKDIVFSLVVILATASSWIESSNFFSTERLFHLFIIIHRIAMSLEIVHSWLLFFTRYG